MDTYLLYLCGASILWTVFFIDHLGYFVLSGVASMWYFAPDRSTIGFSSVKTALSWGILYHFGTIALGSFLVAFIWLLRVIIEAAEQSEKNKGPKKNLVAILVLACLACFAKCLE